jgi:cobalt-zinc-cadmium resistance protein CzcA
MLEKIINFSIKNKLIVMLFTLTIVIFGFYSIAMIPIGAVPDITNNQVQVITTSSNLSTQEIEQFITTPVELEMANLPGVEEIRSVSKFGLSVVTIVFTDEMGTYLPRQLISEKIKSASANIPEGFGTPEMGPITTGLGEIYQYILDVKPGYEDEYTPMELRTIQDWIVKRQLSGIDGVVEVNSWGGYLKQYEVGVDPSQLLSMGVTLLEVYNALDNNNSISGGSYIEKTNQSYFIRGDGQVKSLEDIENIVVKNDGGIPILVKDIADVYYGYANRFGAITANGQGEKVMGQIMMLKDANSNKVIDAVKARVAEVQKGLPDGVFINPILERSELISKTTFTIVENLLLGFVIVILIVLLLLGNLRSALVIASMIPLSLLFTLSMMYVFGIDANLMSLGALDFGIIIDGAVIIVEYIAIKITTRRKDLEGVKGGERVALIDTITFEGASKMMNSAIFGQVIILIVFIPILTLSGVEGKMFRPMALSFSFAIIGAMILGLTWLPVAVSLFIKPQKENAKSVSKWLMNILHKSYEPVIKWSLVHKKTVLSAAVISLVVTGFIFTKMGGEFVPTLDEGDFVIQPVLKTGTSLTKTIEMTTKMENILIKNFPDEVDQIVCRIGAAEVPTDPMSMEEIDMIIKLHPKSDWKVVDTKSELAVKFKEALSVIPGVEYEFTQPIEMRFNELITGVRADIAVKIFGDDLDYLNTKAIEVKQIIEGVSGADDIIIEKTAGLPQMNVVYNRNRVAYYGLDLKMLNRYLAIAFGGEQAGSIFEGEKRFDMVLRLNKENRIDIDNIQNLKVQLPNGKNIPLKELADITFDTGPAKISRENTHRRVVISVNVRGRDLQSVVEDIRKDIDASVKLEPGTYITYGGQFENLQNATKRLMIVVPVALFMIFIFLHFAFKSIKDAMLIFTAIPLSTVGGVFFLWIRGLPFSVSAGIGFIALFGIAVLNGIVLIEHLKELKERGMKDMNELIIKGTSDRLRPVILTAASAAMGFLPMAISTGAGAEVQRPLATVVIGGLVTSTMLTMIALPILFEIFNSKEWNFKNLFMSKKVLSVFVILFLSLPTFAQDNEGMSLDEIINLATENNKALKASSFKIDESRANKGTAFSIDKTQIYYSSDENNMADNGHPLNIIGVYQNFSFPTVYTSQRKVGNTRIAISESEYNLTKNQISKDISLIYNRIQCLYDKQLLYSKIDSMYSVLGEGIKIKYEQGEISKLEMLNASAKKRLLMLKQSKLESDLEIEYQKIYSLVQNDSSFIVKNEDFRLIPIEETSIENSSALLVMRKNVEYEQALLSVEKNKWLPDISLEYFIGSNNYVDAQNYQGFQVGLAIPLFFGEQRSKVKVKKISININEAMQQNYIATTESKSKELKLELEKYLNAIQYYREEGQALSHEILSASEKRYRAGQIDFFQLILSVESALELSMDYQDNIMNYNEVAIEINYLTK